MKNFEKYAQERLLSHETPVDKDRLWAAMQHNKRFSPQSTPNTRNQKRFLVLFLFLASGLLGFWWLQYGRQSQPEVNTSKKNSLPKPSALNGQPLKTPMDGAIAAFELGSGDEIQSVKNASPAPAYSSALSPVDAAKKSSKSAFFTQKNASNPIFEEDFKASLVSEKAETVGRVEPPIENGAYFSSKKTPSNTDASLASKIVDFEKSEVVEKTSNMEFSRVQWGISTLPKSKSVGLSVPLTSDFSVPLFENKKAKDCYDWSTAPAYKRYVGAYLGAAYPLQVLEAKSATYSSYEMNRKATETVLEEVHAGVFVGAHLWRGIVAELGADASRITERFDWEKRTTDTVGMIATIGLLINAPGDTTFFNDTTLLVRETIQNIRHFNRYNFFHIPLSLGYEYRKNSAFVPYIKAGVGLNIHFGHSVRILDAGGTPTVHASNTEVTPFRTNIQLIPWARLGCRWNIQRNLGVFGELRYQHHLNPVSKVSYPITQQYRLPGASIGIQYGF